MKELKDKNIMELLKNIDNITDFLYRHNKNYNKTQYNYIIDLIDNVEELKTRIL